MLRKKAFNFTLFLILAFISLVFLAPVAVVVMNSFKSRFSISQTPFLLPDSDTFVRLDNYSTGIIDTDFLTAFFWSLFITVCSVAVIVIFTSMTAWFIVRSKDIFSKVMYLIT